jgi:uncharacterized protein (TIGR02145 family)
VIFSAFCVVALVALGFGLYKMSQSLFFAVEYSLQPITTMQDMTTDYCNSMPVNTTMKLTDVRNSQDYRVRKMPDGKCWMIDNLKLELTDSTKLSPSDSNVSSDTYVTLATGGRVGNFTTSGYLTVDNSDTGGANYDSWRQANPNDPTQAGTESCVAGNFVDPASTTGCGYLYNWYTTTAGTGTYNTTSGTASSICPKGWRLPRVSVSNADNEFAVLNSAMYNGDLAGVGGFVTDMQYVRNWWHMNLFAGPRSGSYINNFAIQGKSGYLWSSSAYSSDFAWFLDFSDDLVDLTDYLHKYSGFGIRCLSN